MFRNIARSMTGVSATTAFSSVVIGAIGVVMIVVGGRAIVAGTMTLGDLISYIFFTGLMAAPIVQIASIGTQITEAFAGLDRIREIMQTPTEDDGDATRAALSAAEGDIAFEGVWFEYREGIPVLKDISFVAKEGTTTALVPSTGAFLTLDWSLTGEPSDVRGLAPARPFDPAQGQWGAWQLVARMAQINVGDAAFPVLADPAVAYTVITSGQSGQPLQRHYDDQVPLWLNGGYLRMTIDWNTIEHGDYDHCELRP